MVANSAYMTVASMVAHSVEKMAVLMADSTVAQTDYEKAEMWGSHLADY
jgi:hypothetical protein